MSNIGDLSKLHPRCKNCNYRDDCDDKRMVACKLGKLPSQSLADISLSATAPLTAPLTEPLLKEYTPIQINMGEYGTIDTSLEEIYEQLKKKIYKGIDCGFNKI